MRQIAMFAVLVLAFAAVAGTADPPSAPRAPAAKAPGEPPPTRAKPAAATRPSPAAKGAIDPGVLADRPVKDEDAIPPALIRAAKDSFVIVETWYKKDLTEPPSVLESDYRLREIYSEYIDQKRPALQAGLVLDAAGRVIVPDDAIEQRFIDKIQIRDVTGRRYPAQRQETLLDAPGVILSVARADAGKLKPLRFAQVVDKGLNTKLLVAQLEQSDDEWRIRAGPITPALKYEPAEGHNVFFGYRFSGRYGRYPEPGGHVQLVADEDGRPVGVSLLASLDLRQTEGLWHGTDLVRAAGVTMADLAKTKAAARSKLSAAVQEIVFTLRQGASPILPGPDPDRYSYRYRSGGAASGREITAYGLAISPTEILVPVPLTRQAAAQIEKIQVKFSPRDRAEGEFVGAFKGFGAVVIKLAKGKLPAHVSVAERTEDLPRMKPFWVARMEKRFGKKYVRLSTNRIVGKMRGYAGKYHWQPCRNVEGGSVLVDFQGRLAGAYLTERIEHEEAKRLESGQSDRYSRYGRDSRERIFTISELRGPLAKPQDHMDPKIQVKTKREAKRRAWFGVEYIPMTRELAEQWKIEKPTKDGQLGFLVNAVYAGSPAEKMGVRVGDVLLLLKAPGVPYPIELNAVRVRDEMDYGNRWRWRGGYDEDEEELGILPPTWKGRRNFLTRGMDAIGVGKKISLTYYRLEGKGKGNQITLDYTIEQAPRDFESAAMWKNRKLGLTVKDMTYEVRHALNIRDEAPGVILAKVEPGSPTLVAKIFPFEIITRLNDKPIKSARAMRDTIAAARKAGRKKVRLTILRLGKTRFADLTISEYDPKDDEGLDEE